MPRIDCRPDVVFPELLEARLQIPGALPPDSWRDIAVMPLVYHIAVHALGFFAVAYLGSHLSDRLHAVQEELDYCRKQLDAHLAEFNELLKTDVNIFNKLAVERNASTLFAGEPVQIKTGEASSAAGK